MRLKTLRVYYIKLGCSNLRKAQKVNQFQQLYEDNQRLWAGHILYGNSGLTSLPGTYATCSLVHSSSWARISSPKSRFPADNRQPNLVNCRNCVQNTNYRATWQLTVFKQEGQTCNAWSCESESLPFRAPGGCLGRGPVTSAMRPAACDRSLSPA